MRVLLKVIKVLAVLFTAIIFLAFVYYKFVSLEWRDEVVRDAKEAFSINLDLENEAKIESYDVNFNFRVSSISITIKLADIPNANKLENCFDSDLKFLPVPEFFDEENPFIHEKALKSSSGGCIGTTYYPKGGRGFYAMLIQEDIVLIRHVK